MLDDVDSNEYTNTLSNDFPSWGDNYSGAAYEDFGGWGATRGLIKDWRWLARLVEKHTHRGLIYYGVYLIVIISGLIMCVTPVADITIKPILEEDYANPLIIGNDISPMDIENDVVHSIRSFSLNNLIDGSRMPELTPSSWGRFSITYPASHDIPSDTTSTISDTSEIFANKMRLWGAIYHLGLRKQL